jgi:hypothetical protein
MSAVICESRWTLAWSVGVLLPGLASLVLAIAGDPAHALVRWCIAWWWVALAAGALGMFGAIALCWLRDAFRP